MPTNPSFGMTTKINIFKCVLAWRDSNQSIGSLASAGKEKKRIWDTFRTKVPIEKGYLTVPVKNITLRIPFALGC